MSWVDTILQAMEELGGYASLSDLYERIELVRNEPLAETWRGTVRRTIQQYSSDSVTFTGEDLFYSVAGIGSGIWGLRELQVQTPVASDIDGITNPDRSDSVGEAGSEPDRSQTTIYRILRDSRLAREIKMLYSYRCQICEEAIRLDSQTSYAEAHHIQPLGQPHFGPDMASNILCLCPNHHVTLDYGAITLKLDDLNLHAVHQVSENFLEYHNRYIFRG